MLERITLEMLQELTEEQKEKLRELWEPNYGDMFIYEGSNKIDVMHIPDMINFNKKYCLPMLSIGQMISILGQEKASRVIMREWRNNELVECLWEAVKSIL